ncbi:class I adenylate-forming enzyme family protein [Rhodococcus sp. IEGM 1408]|uniref:class I adenylate-forming enzyme family protein n=1 Tax=Rhodococcus sp. IEGM 1408 TaxID=3082220 RepID=UPI002952964F|nr:class I adenylate-forming enzyme family protein [Rhodococcus sp. IEGM 1408]MDV8002629.1 class I adenylate-forming enzyme family protein [Rhodococcus sp. IEGM 1408]
MKQLAQDVIERAAHTPGDLAVVDGEGAHDIAEILREARALAEVIGGAVDGPPTVLIRADNSWRTVSAAVAVGLVGGLLAVMSGHATRSEFDIAAEDLQPDVVVTTADIAEVWGLAEHGFVEAGRSLGDWVVAGRSDGRSKGVERWNGGAVAAMTSGSTGRPKCVIQTEDALRYAGRATIEAVGLEPGDAVGALVPLSSAAAICFGMYLPTMLGGAMVASEKWNPEAALALLREQRVAWTMLVPTMALQLTLADGAEGALSAMRAMTVGGGPMNQKALHNAELKLDTTLLRVFGMSECLGHTTPLPSDDVEVRLGRDGRPFPGTEVRVVDEAGSVVEPGELGSLQVRGPSLFIGYARQGVPVAPDVNAEGYLATGDRAVIHDDGSVSIRGREKDLIIRGGRNIDINEVEDALAAIPGIHQVCVVPVPDPVLGERAAALVVSDGEAPSLEVIRRHLEAADFPKFKWPEFVRSVSTLPQSRVGKLDRKGAAGLAAEIFND